MARSRTAIPLSIDLILRDTTFIVPATLLLERLTQLKAHVENDRERGRREVLENRDELLAKGTPEILLAGLQPLAERTFAVTIRWDEWPGNQLKGHISDANPCLDSPSFGVKHHEFAFTKFASMELGKALNASVRLTSKYGSSIETEFFPKETTPTEWVQDYYATLDASGARHDPDTKTITPFPKRHPMLRELDSWQGIIELAVVRFLEQSRKANADDITEGFSTYVEYANLYTKELSEFGTIKHCWSVELDESHHNQAFIEYDEWFALIRLSGVPSGLFDPQTYD